MNDQQNDGAAGVATDPEQRSYSTRQVLLGVLVVGQLFFILAANTLNGLSSMRRITGDNEDVGLILDHVTGGITSYKGHLYDVYRSVINRWEEAWWTGQNWRLFSPYVADWCCLLSVELRWDDRAPGEPAAPGARPPVVLPSSNEPEDLERYARLGPWRFRRYEAYISFNLRVEWEEGETEAQAKTRWKPYLQRSVDENWDTINAYLNWKWVNYRRSDPDCPQPRQIFLITRCWWIRPPDEAFAKLVGPTVVPVARWEPGRDKAGTRNAIQTYDPETGQFALWERPR